MDKATLFRYFGNALVILGYYILLWGDAKLGLIIKIVAAILLAPSFIVLKMWDSITICGFYMAIEISKLYSLIVTDGR